jgi:uncharacterized protein YbbC (DUF1343 family)
MKNLSLSVLTAACLLALAACSHRISVSVDRDIITGDERITEYLGLLKGKKVGIVANQTSIAGKTHVVDTLVSLGVDVRVIFAPEHGFRNMADAGETVLDGKDSKTGIRVISLYGTHNKPTPADLDGLDIVIYDIQDVGTRFYTYISTMTLVMESCAENKIKFMVLDRPNPNGFYVDGPVPDSGYRSFVCMHKVPVVYGMTPGEYAMMVNGEGWLKAGVKCSLSVVSCSNYSHSSYYELPVKPSPNLPNQVSVLLYPTLCFFEGTALSCGRGTPFPFQVFGSPELPDRGFSFTPKSGPGSKTPLLMDKRCYGTDLRDALKNGTVPIPRLSIELLIGAYRDFPNKDKFFNSYFDTLAGGPSLREQITAGLSAAEIRASWQKDLEKFKEIRKKYLLYL